ncbi:MAG: hypothetical protein ACTHWW_11990 [Arthrobacter sp.]|uniref:hypothetical protein n=1 Tax=Arthrobacter sp. AOP36-C1-22 TaxID=3457683 RepID=UPI00264DAA27|nr:hypothetical protein [Micrococcaceae bacterium]MDN5824744.1 hypothetical protein [Micrococcaceae bacterium]MDN5880471.1 hypothetical protein [Micrococcaceae bacterium]MDN5888075.1 hypothetical protein [Micrococcaceae bacterium]MDN6171165.1 hypothetical protein [Micrococcaceae bacterium]
MARHASTAGSTRTRQTALLGWGLFIAVLVVVVSPMLGLHALGAAALGVTAAVVFVVLYFLSGVTT